MGGVLRPGGSGDGSDGPVPGDEDGTGEGRRKRVVIVDDSPTMRSVIARLLSMDPRLEVVGMAGDPYEARAIIKSTMPDVITLDIEMPRMDGLAFLEKIMRLRPMPVVMLSSETHAGSRAAVEALSLGAVDCVGKPGAVGGGTAFEDLADRVHIAACARVRHRPDGRSEVVRATASGTAAHPGERPVGEGRALGAPGADDRGAGYAWGGMGVLIGASTGGVDALERLLGALPPNAPPTVITQHMPTSFLESFAQRLKARVAPRVALASEGARLRQGHILIAPGGERHLAVQGGPESGVCRLVEGPKRSGHRPSVDVLFESALGPHAARFVAVLLTGMGRDGADGMLALRRSGAHTIAQDRQSSVVYGMPRVAREIGAAEEVAPLEGIAARLLEITGRSTGKASTA